MEWTRWFLGYCGVGVALPAILVLAVALALLLALAFYGYLLIHCLGVPPRLLVDRIAALRSGYLEESAVPPVILAFPTRR